LANHYGIAARNAFDRKEFIQAWFLLISSCIRFFSAKEMVMEINRNLPIRLTVCDTADHAVEIVEQLRVAGFAQEEITVVCSQEVGERKLKPYMHQDPAGAHASDALNIAGLSALGLGAAAVVVGVLTTAGTAVMAIGAVSGLAIGGTFASLMATRGMEKELADYFDQAISHGKILVGVETTDPTRQHIADEILSQGSETQVLPKESPT
jgi:hypothetical protein